MFTPTSAIADWRDLQNKVASLFREMGYDVEIERLVELAGRGRKKIDVYIRDDRASVNQIMLVECKHWSAAVPQETVHGMQTVMRDSGANTGFIISKAGFQKGAYEAAQFSNIHLLTWEELQHKFGNQWLRYQKEQLAPLIAEIRGFHTKHTDRSLAGAAHMNNMKFVWEDAIDHLKDLIDNMQVSLWAAQSQPKSYDDPGPIETMAYQDFPGAKRDRFGIEVLRFADVRAFYAWLTPWAQELIDIYKDLSERIHESFSGLPDGEQNDAFKKAMRRTEGEMPIRLFREILGEEAYLRLFDKLERETTAEE